MNIETAKQKLTKLGQAHSESAAMDAQVLLAQITGQTRTWVVAHPEALLNATQLDSLSLSINKLEQGIPLPYILGVWSFFGRAFNVTPAVLIPRPETELLIETALNWLRANPDKRTGIDVGTGSGIIPITLTCEIDDLVMQAVDISSAAVTVARENVVRHDMMNRVSITENDLLKNIEGSFDLITANLPYIPTQTLLELAVYKTEPTLALDGGSDGLDLIRILMNELPEKLASGGMALFEIDASQGEHAATVARAAFPTGDIEVLHDLAGHARIVKVIRELV